MCVHDTSIAILESQEYTCHSHEIMQTKGFHSILFADVRYLYLLFRFRLKNLIGDDLAIVHIRICYQPRICIFSPCEFILCAWFVMRLVGLGICHRVNDFCIGSDNPAIIPG